MSLDCIILGAPGAGKGTQAQLLAQFWRIPHISTGAMLREAVRSGTPLGRRVDPIVRSGGLIDDAVMGAVVAERLQRSDARAGFILDGYPRTLGQAQALDVLTRDRGPLLIIDIVVPDAQIVERVASRRLCLSCAAITRADRGPLCPRCGGSLGMREDDEPDVVRRRLELYHRETAPIVEYYAGRPTLWSVDGSRSPRDVTAAILRSVDRLRAIAV